MQLSINDCQTFGSMLEGLEYVSNLVSRYTIFELLYLKPNLASTAAAKDQLALCLLRLYTAVLQYLSQASHYYARGTVSVFYELISLTLRSILTGSIRADNDQYYTAFSVKR